MNILTFEKGRSCGNMAKRFKQYACVFSQAPTTSQTVHQAEWQLWCHRGVGPSEKAKSRNLEKIARKFKQYIDVCGQAPSPATSQTVHWVALGGKRKLQKYWSTTTKILLSAGQRDHQRFIPTYCLPICPEYQRSLDPDVLTWAPNHMTRNGLLCNSHMEIPQLRTFHTIVRTQV